jgi:hypothetical protein
MQLHAREKPVRQIEPLIEYIYVGNRPQRAVRFAKHSQNKHIIGHWRDESSSSSLDHLVFFYVLSSSLSLVSVPLSVN